MGTDSGIMDDETRCGNTSGAWVDAEARCFSLFATSVCRSISSSLYGLYLLIYIAAFFVCIHGRRGRVLIGFIHFSLP